MHPRRHRRRGVLRGFLPFVMPRGTLCSAVPFLILHLRININLDRIPGLHSKTRVRKMIRDLARRNEVAPANEEEEEEEKERRIKKE